jgi:hypothetical protein
MPAAGSSRRRRRGLRGQGARDFEAALQAVGEAAGDGVRRLREADEIEKPSASSRLFVFPARKTLATQEQRQGRERAMLELRDEDVFEHGHLGKEPDVLERARHARAQIWCGRVR